MIEEYLTVPKAAKLIQKSRAALYEAIHAGRLPSTEMLDRVVVSLIDVLAYQERTAAVGSRGGRPPAARQEAGSVSSLAATAVEKRPRGRPRNP